MYQSMREYSNNLIDKQPGTLTLSAEGYELEESGPLSITRLSPVTRNYYVTFVSDRGVEYRFRVVPADEWTNMLVTARRVDMTVTTGDVGAGGGLKNPSQGGGKRQTPKTPKAPKPKKGK